MDNRMLDGGMCAFKLEPGEELLDALQRRLGGTGGTGSLLLMGLQAQFDHVILGCYDPETKTYVPVQLTRPTMLERGEQSSYSLIEPGAVTGNVTWVNGEPFAHVHGSFFSGNPKDGGKLLGGGHVMSAFTGRTCEGLLWVSPTTIVREFDERAECMVRTWRFVGRDSGRLTPLGGD